MTGASVQGCRILVVEDDYMIARDVQDGLEKAGAAVIGPVPTAALHHAGSGARVIMALTASDGAARLTVSDTGRGAHLEILPRLFDRFVRGDTSRTSSRHGLGLSLVRAIVLSHGGAVHAYNASPGFAIELTMPLDNCERPACRAR